MTTQYDKAKPWQFGLKECLLLTALVATPIAVFRAAESSKTAWGAAALAISFGMAGGVLIGPACWAISGARKGFVIGYIAGAILGAACYLILTVNIYVTPDNEREAFMAEREAATARQSTPRPNAENPNP